MLYRILTISGQPRTEITVQHFIHDDILDPDITVYTKAFNQTLMERLDDTNFIFNVFDGFGVRYEISGIPQWDTW